MFLFKDRYLNIAILISASSHLACLFMIEPFIETGPIRSNVASVTFLGSIIEKVVTMPERQFSLDDISLMDKIEKLKSIEPKNISLTPPEDVSKGISPQSEKEKFLFPQDRYKDIAFKVEHQMKPKTRIRFGDTSITGDAKNRIILYKPVLEDFAPLSTEFNSDYDVSIRFKVSPHGFVENPECITSSGSLEADQMAMRYIRKWQEKAGAKEYGPIVR